MTLFESNDLLLLETENPVKWKPRNELEAVPDNMIKRLLQKIREKSVHENFQYESIILNVTLSYEYYVDSKLEESIETLRTVEKKITRYQMESCADAFVNSCLPALLHIVKSAKACILLHKSDSDTAREASYNIPSISEMDLHNKAAILGLKASFYAEYGIYGSKFGVQYAIKAIKSDPECSLWYFLKGKLLGRIRRVEKPFDIPDKSELDALEMAIAKELNPAYMVFTAEVYRETAYRVFSIHRNKKTLFPSLKEKIDRMNEASFDLYKKSLVLKRDDPHIMFRCAKGFMKLPEPYRDDKLTKELLKKGLEMAPDNPFGHHVMAQYYERREKNFVSAVKHLRICAEHNVFGGCIDLLRIQINQKKLSEEKIISTLNNLYEEHPEPARRCQILSQLASFYIFERPNLHKAYDYLIRIFRLNINCDDVNKHRSLFVRIYSTISLVDVLIDEIKIKLQDKECDADERKKYEEYLIDLCELGVRVSCNLPLYLKNRIIQESEQGMKKPNKRSNVNWKPKPNHRNAPPTAAIAYRQNFDKFKKPSLQTQSEITNKIESFAEKWKRDIQQKREQVVPKKVTMEKQKEYITADNDSHQKDDDYDSDTLLRLNTYETAIRTMRERDVEDEPKKIEKKQNRRCRQNENSKKNSRDGSCSLDDIIDECEKMGLSEKSTRSIPDKKKNWRRNDKGAKKEIRDQLRSPNDVIDQFEKMGLSDKSDRNALSKRSSKTKVRETEKEKRYTSPRYTEALVSEVDSDFEESVLAYRKMKEQAQSKDVRVTSTASKRSARFSVSPDSKYNKDRTNNNQPNRDTKSERSVPRFSPDSRGVRHERYVGQDRHRRYQKGTDDEKLDNNYHTDQAHSSIKSSRKVYQSDSSNSQSKFSGNRHSEDDDDDEILNIWKEIASSTFEPKNIRF